MDKELLTELIQSKKQIELHNYLQNLADKFLEKFKEFDFSRSTQQIKPQFSDLIHFIDENLLELRSAMLFIGYYGNNDLSNQISAVHLRLSSRWNEFNGGKQFWNLAPWYSNLSLLYSLGLGTMAGSNPELLIKVLNRPFRRLHRNEFARYLPLLIDICSQFNEGFKHIESMEQKYVPRSEHLSQLLLSDFSSLIPSKEEYELRFNMFELLLAAEYLNVTEEFEQDYSSFPIGLFGYNHRRLNYLEPFVYESESMIQAGFFNCSHDRFNEILSHIKSKIKHLRW